MAVERVQVQAIPHDYQIPDGLVPVRRFFKPKPGHELWEFDLSQAEGRVAAAITQCEPWIEAYGRGDDIHGATCTTVFGIAKGHPDWDEYRAVSKRLVLGTLYGAGPPTIRQQIKIFTGIEYSVVESEDLVARFRNALPEVYRYSRSAAWRAERLGYVTLVNGRKRWFTKWERDQHEERKAFNAEIQGDVAVGVTDWMIEVEKHRPGVLLLQIHDSLVCELPVEYSERWADQIAACGARIFQRYFKIPFIVDRKEWKAPGRHNPDQDVVPEERGEPPSRQIAL